MTRAMLRRRLRALAHDERGFTILETVIAITVMFARMVALAYTATVGFKSIAYARERVTFNGVADRIMEEIRGQAYSKIQTGLLDVGSGRRPEHHQLRRVPDRVPIRVVLDRGEDRELRRRAATPWINPHRARWPRRRSPTTSATRGAHTSRTTIPTTQPYRRHGDRPMGERRLSEQGEQPGQDPEPVRLARADASTRRRIRSARPCQPFFYGLAQVPAGQIAITRHRAGTDVHAPATCRRPGPSPTSRTSR